MKPQRLNPDGFPQPLAAYCYVTKKGPMVFTAGMVALDEQGNVVGEGDAAAQTREVIESIRKALAAAGADLEDVVKTTIFLSDLGNYKAMNAVYSEYFGQNPPVRSCIEAKLVLPTLLVEIEAVAVVD